MLCLQREETQDKVGLYARKEFCRLFALLSGEGIVEDDWEKDIPGRKAVLMMDGLLQEQEICVEAEEAGLKIRGGSYPALLHAIYVFFEQLGCVFDLSGENLPERRPVLQIPAMKLRHVPGVRERGIRMHLNFVQDQSFFTRNAFEAFIDNMARQKFNYLCFHMYTPQQWFPFTYRGVRPLDLSLGNLERKHIVEEMTGRERVKVLDHWFPAEFEKLQEPEELLAAVYGRYRDMMARCRQRGIRVSLSMEPEALPEALADKLTEWSGSEAGKASLPGKLPENWQEGWSGKKLVKPDVRHPLMVDIGVERYLQCIDAFPDLDEVQLISREGTAWHPEEGDSYSQEISRLEEKFHLEAGTLEESLLEEVAKENGGPRMNPKAHPYWTVLPGDSYYATVLGSLRFVEFALEILADRRLLEKIKDRDLKVSIAVYSPNPGTVERMLPAISQMLPSGTRFHLIGDYGARDIAGQMDTWLPLRKRGQNTGVISWLEFDGCMMLAQNWMESLERNMQKVREQGLETVYFNHWRVRSMEHNAAAASALCWDSGQDIRGFYQRYFSTLYGETSAEKAVFAYELLEKATVYAKEKNYNIGFTKDWVFMHSTDVPGYYWAYLAESAENYSKAGEAFSALSESCSPRGKRQAAYMGDLCRISALHIRAVYHLQNAKLPLIGYMAWPTDNVQASWPPPEMLETLLEEAEKAVALEREYMAVYARWVSDCDEQGQLVMHQQGVVEPMEGFASALRAQLEKEKKKVRGTVL